MATCVECKERCNLIKIDEGIGSYEFWGAKGFDSRVYVVSDCCEADYELDPYETVESHFEPDYYD